MQTINLKKYYPECYKQDELMDVSDELAALLQQMLNEEKAYYLRMYRHSAYYSLERDEGIEKSYLCQGDPPEAILDRRDLNMKLYGALKMLTCKQRRRIYAHFMLKLSMAEIARMEGVRRSAVRESVKTGLGRMQMYLAPACANEME